MAPERTADLCHLVGGRLEAPHFTEGAVIGTRKAALFLLSAHRKNPVRYQYYRWGCGRDRRLKELWGAAPASEEKKE